MARIEPKRRRTLNNKQLHLLRLIYKFRFVGVSLVQEIQNIKDKSTTYNRLKVLEDQGYIGRNYESGYRLLHKPACYYLLPKGIAQLKHQPGIGPKALHAMYKNRAVSDSFINQCINTFKVYTVFRKLYPEYSFFTKSELADLDYFPKQLPDAYLQPSDGAGQEYFLDNLETGAQFFLIKRKLAGYIEHYESEAWQHESDKDYPSVLLVCSTPSMEASLHKHIPKLLHASGAEIDFYTTSAKALFGLADKDDKIWSPIDDPEELVAL